MMTTADQVHSKAVAETKDLVVDCNAALANGETIVGTPTYAVSAPNDLTITGVVVNPAVVSEPGFPDVPIGQAIQCFVGGGTADTVYTITFTYNTSGGQTDLQASVKLKVTS